MARALPDRPILRNAIALSVAVHGVLLLGLGPLAQRGAWGAEEAHDPAADHFAGDSPVTGDLVDIATDSGSQSKAGSESEPEPEPESEPEPEPEPEPESESESESESEPSAPPPRTASKPPAPPAAPSGASASATPPLGTSARGAAGSFGAAGPARDARNLAYAFTRAIPPMSDSDEAWAALPVGDAGEMILTLHVDDEGRIDRLIVAKEPAAPPHLRKLAKKVAKHLRLGVFALRPMQVDAGSLVLRIHATVRDVPVPEDVPAGPFDLRFEFADGHGAAGFTQVSGRRVDLSVDALPVDTLPVDALPVDAEPPTINAE